MDWSEGYLTEEYVFGYFSELSPTILRLACLCAGIAPPAAKPLRYLELGYGQGVSINMHAAAVSGEFWGTDFNPTQTAYARALADASGSGVTLLNDSFAELAERSDLPKFDIIVVHGIWTWISDENRRIIVDIIKRRLEVGGLVYISYNCFPGWAPAAPLRHLIKLYGDLARSDAGLAERLDAGMRFTQQVIDAGALYFRKFPAVVEKLKGMSAYDPNYLSHEYFTRDWKLMTFSDVARALSDAKLTFAASGTILNHIDSMIFEHEWRKLLSGIEHPILRQSVRDYVLNAPFRNDIFAKGLCRLTRTEQREMLRAQMFVLTNHPDNIPMTVGGTTGEVALPQEIFQPLIEVLAEENYAPKTLRQLTGHAKLKAVRPADIFEAILMLVGTYHVCPVQEVASESRKHCGALNRYLCERARDEGNVPFLVSPLTATGVFVGRTEQLILLAAQLGKKTVAEQAAYVNDILSAEDLSLVNKGKTLQTAEENIAQLTHDISGFNEKRLSVFKTLGLV